MSEVQENFVSILKQEATALEDLYGLLMKELVALKERNTDSITELSKEKNNALDKLGMIDKERQLYIEDKTHNSNFANKNEINELSSEIEICLKKCKQQNNINGGIIEMSQLFNEKILDIVCGNHEQQTTYGATGKNHSKNNQQHSLGRA
jgi:flagellar biosynthesis protein FlgN